jgi:small subunit ribosomal protein S17
MTNSRRTQQGIVVKKGSAQSVRVKVEKKQAHPLYGKVVRSHKHYLVHCADMDSVEVGDVVIIGEIKPVSKRKSWEVMSKVEVKHK